MLKRLLFVLLSVFLLATSGEARTIGGVELDESLKLADLDSALTLNGGGIREKFFVDIYVAGLYLMKKNNDFVDIMGKDENMAIKIQITSKLVTSERFTEATEEGFNRTTNNNPASIQKEIDQALKVFDSKFNVGDVFDIVYIKGLGTKFYKNGSFIATVKGLEFKKALFGIWIIDKPSHKCENLRLGMLGLK